MDHFVPWSRYPDDSRGNLVVAHARCNGAKRDHLAAVAHVRRWLERSQQASALETIAAKLAWPRAPGRSLSVARSIYFRLPDEARLWQIADEFVPLRRGKLTEAFSSAA